MINFILRRLLQMVILLPILSVVVFKIISLMPNPLDEALKSNPKMTIRDKVRLEKLYNLDKPPVLNFDVKDLSKNIENRLKHIAPPQKPEAFKNSDELKALEAKAQIEKLNSSDRNRRNELRKKSEVISKRQQLYSTNQNKHKAALDDLKNWGHICIPKLMEYKKKWQQEIEKDNRDSEETSPYLEKAVQLHQVLEEIVGEQPKGDWISWYGENEKYYELPHRKRTVARLKKKKKREIAEDDILKRGSLYVEFLIEELDKSSSMDEEHMNSVLRLLAVLTANYEKRKGYKERKESFQTIENGGFVKGARAFSTDDRRGAVYYWLDWWRKNDSEYRNLMPSDKFVRVFTHTQYGTWLGRILRSLWEGNFFNPDFGTSRVYNEPVIKRLKQTLVNTLSLTVFAFLLSIITAIPLGIIAAVYQYSKTDYAINSFAFIGMSVPTFFSGLLAIVFFGNILDWLPSGGMYNPKIASLGSWVDEARHLVLPVFILAYFEIAILIRYMRSAMLEVIDQDYIRTARAKGLDEDMVIFKHALRNALVPVITILALSIPWLFSGALITETIFSWDGMGNLLYNSVLAKDSDLVMPAFMFLAFLSMTFNLFADVLYALVDPRIQHN